ncbi:Fic family protein [Desulfosarcina sp.]|uniref:Fic family protein n=1 Tax=Desulfosarcina sp. TaxID=2027861 RepID=UPI0029A544A0|nr:Fic family protein [Desulfosarcina sp.]MDX2451741.1 Fic family protein [Desulfosarcina sp.]MDX2489528.1 Fic family protein [Desulfosarcina sp.]
MEFVNQRLSEEHKRLIDTLLEESAQVSDCVIDIVDVLNAHFLIIDYFFENGEGGKGVAGIGPIDKGLLSSAVAAQKTEYSGKLKWKTDYEKCAALFYGLIKNHPFHNYNQITALLTALYYLSRLNHAPTASHKELEIITRIIASNTIRDRKAFKPFSKFENGEIRFLAQYFQRNIRPLDESDYKITYSELNRILGGFGFSLNYSHGNSIDIVRIEKRSSFFGLPKTKGGHTSLGTIGFAGWKREVPKKEMKLIQAYTGLAANETFNPRILYKKGPPLSSLINLYGGIFPSLAPN